MEEDTPLLMPWGRRAAVPNIAYMGTARITVSMAMRGGIGGLPGM